MARVEFDYLVSCGPDQAFDEWKTMRVYMPGGIKTNLAEMDLRVEDIEIGSKVTCFKPAAKSRQRVYSMTHCSPESVNEVYIKPMVIGDETISEEVTFSVQGEECVEINPVRGRYRVRVYQDETVANFSPAD